MIGLGYNDCMGDETTGDETFSLAFADPYDDDGGIIKSVSGLAYLRFVNAFTLITICPLVLPPCWSYLLSGCMYLTFSLHYQIRS